VHRNRTLRRRIFPHKPRTKRIAAAAVVQLKIVLPPLVDSTQRSVPLADNMIAIDRNLFAVREPTEKSTETEP
jgi:hypothetical protein